MLLFAGNIILFCNNEIENTRVRFAIRIDSIRFGRADRFESIFPITTKIHVDVRVRSWTTQKRAWVLWVCSQSVSRMYASDHRTNLYCKTPRYTKYLENVHL